MTKGLIDFDKQIDVEDGFNRDNFNEMLNE